MVLGITCTCILFPLLPFRWSGHTVFFLCCGMSSSAGKNFYTLSTNFAVISCEMSGLFLDILFVLVEQVGCHWCGQSSGIRVDLYELWWGVWLSSRKWDSLWTSVLLCGDVSHHRSPAPCECWPSRMVVVWKTTPLWGSKW